MKKMEWGGLEGCQVSFWISFSVSQSPQLYEFVNLNRTEQIGQALNESKICCCRFNLKASKHPVQWFKRLIKAQPISYNSLSEHLIQSFTLLISFLDCGNIN